MKAFCLIAFACFLYTTHAALQTKFIEDLCFFNKVTSMQIRYERSGILMSVPRHDSNGEFQCQLTLIPERQHSIVLSIYRYDIADGDTLIIEDSDRHRISLIGWATFKDEKKSITSDGNLIIKYTRNDTAQVGISSRRGFQFTYTQVSEFSNGQCFSDHYRCKNNKCIPKNLACDGHNHCGDNSDQISCVPGGVAPTSRPSQRGNDTAILWISAISISAAILVILIVVFIIMIIRKPAKKPPTEEQGSNEIAMQSVSATVAPSDSQPQVPQNDTQNSARPRESVFNYLRRSFRGQRKPDVEQEIPTRHETFQVPSMYPNLDQIPSAPELSGTENIAYSNNE